MRRILTDGSSKFYPDAEDRQARAEDRQARAEYFDSIAPRRALEPEVELAIAQRLAGHSPAFREAWFSTRPDHRAIWDRYYPK